METSAFLEFIRLVIAGDIDRVSRRLSAAPALATTASPVGATRQQARDFFFTAISHYLYAGDTALHMAAAAFSRPMAELLVSHGADCRARNRRGGEPLHYAADGGPTGPTGAAGASQRDRVPYLNGRRAQCGGQDWCGATAPGGPNAVDNRREGIVGWRRGSAATEQVGLDAVTSGCAEHGEKWQRFGRGTPATGSDHQALAGTWREADG
jgi:hypothetical protein